LQTIVGDIGYKAQIWSPGKVARICYVFNYRPYEFEIVTGAIVEDESDGSWGGRLPLDVKRGASKDGFLKARVVDRVTITRALSSRLGKRVS